LKESFYLPSPEPLAERWNPWLQRWRDHIASRGDASATSQAMKRVNPKITWREWLIAPAYQQAGQGDRSLIQELQQVFRHPYDNPSAELEVKYNRPKPGSSSTPVAYPTTAVRPETLP
jgi:uncharacterized protein YdiU (UPF0061 family)